MSNLSHQSPIRFQAKLPEEVDVVIIGGGIIGICSAWFLSKSGLRVLVCEKGRVAGEQSSRNWGWIRQQGRDEAELPIMIESMRLWEQLSTELGSEIGFNRRGSLYLFEQDSELERYRKFIEFAPDYNLDCELLNRDQINKLVNNTPGKWISALYTASDARAEPELAVPTMAAACSERGVFIIENCAVSDLVLKNNTIEGVITEQGPVRCGAVLCSGGVWSSSLLSKIGIRLPQLAVKASVARTATAPLIFDGNAAGSNLAFRRRLDGGYTIAMTDYLEFFPGFHSLCELNTFFSLLKTAHKKINLRFDSSLWKQLRATPYTLNNPPAQQDRVVNPIPTALALRRLRKKINQVLPALESIDILHSWAGMIDATPDAVPVMDKSPVAGLFVATGFSGHGFGIGPAAGRIMSQLVQNKACDHDLSRFRLSRFSDGSELIPGPSI